MTVLSSRLHPHTIFIKYLLQARVMSTEHLPINDEQAPPRISFGIRQFIMRLATIVVAAVLILMVIRYVVL